MCTYTQATEHVLGLLVDVELARFVLREVESRHFGDILILPLALLFLQFERNAAHGTVLNATHQVRDVSSNLTMAVSFTTQRQGVEGF